MFTIFDKSNEKFENKNLIYYHNLHFYTYASNNLFEFNENKIVKNKEDIFENQEKIISEISNLNFELKEANLKKKFTSSYNFKENKFNSKGCGLSNTIKVN